MKITRSQKGFTLIEMMIAMTIFVIFIGAVMQSYLSIITTQREANEYRVMYSEARHIFDKFSDEVRNGNISYQQLGQGIANPLNQLVLTSPDLSRAVRFQYDSTAGAVYFSEALMNSDGQFDLKPGYSLNSDRIKIKEFKIYVSPLVDPYKPENVYNSATQYQPKVTVFAKFEKEIGSGRTLDIDLQTTISSRSYMQGYEQDNPVPIFGAVVQVIPSANLRISLPILPTDNLKKINPQNVKIK